MDAKIWTKIFICCFWNLFYGNCCFSLSTLEVVLRQSEVLLPRYGRNVYSVASHRFYGIRRSTLALFRLFCVNRRYGYQDTDENLYSLFLKPVYGICRCSFSTLEIVLRRSEVLLPIYEWKTLFTSFKNGFMAFAVVLLVLWRLVCNHGRFCCQDTGKNVYFLFLKPVLRHSPFNF